MPRKLIVAALLTCCVQPAAAYPKFNCRLVAQTVDTRAFDYIAQDLELRTHEAYRTKKDYAQQLDAELCRNVELLTI